MGTNFLYLLFVNCYYLIMEKELSWYTHDMEKLISYMEYETAFFWKDKVHTYMREVTYIDYPTSNIKQLPKKCEAGSFNKIFENISTKNYFVYNILEYGTGWESPTKFNMNVYIPNDPFLIGVIFTETKQKGCLYGIFKKYSYKCNYSLFTDTISRGKDIIFIFQHFKDTKYYILTIVHNDLISQDNITINLYTKKIINGCIGDDGNLIYSHIYNLFKI